MLKTGFIAVALVCAFATNAEARQRHRSYLAHPDCNGTGPNAMPCEGVVPSPRGLRIEAKMPFGVAQKVYRPRVSANWQPIDRHLAAAKADHRAYPGHQKPRPPTKPHWIETASYGVPSPSMGYSVSRAVSGIVAPLAAKVAEIQSACGSRVVSAVRHTRIAGTRRMSLHASGQAVDLVGSPACMYGLLTNWQGGASTDYGRVRHLHLSWGGPEHGLRFAHYSRHSRHQKHRRYASLPR